MRLNLFKMAYTTKYNKMYKIESQKKDKHLTTAFNLEYILKNNTSSHHPESIITGSTQQEL